MASMSGHKIQGFIDPSGRQRNSFLLHVSAGERELDKVLLDHSYSKTWNSHPGASHSQPAKMLFVPKSLRVSKLEKLYSASSHDVIVTMDKEEESQSLAVPYDINRARVVMNECERHVSFARANPRDERTDEDWEEKLNRTGWTQPQAKLFGKILKQLQADRLSKLACQGTANEPVLRRIYIDKCAKMVRKTLASVGWDLKLTQWLHNVLVQNLSNSLLGSYLNVLQTLRPKIPSLIDKMLGLRLTSNRSSSTSNEALSLLLKRPWDPTVGLLSQHKPNKLPGSPIILMAPQSPVLHTGLQYRRMKFWQTQLSGMGKVVPVTIHTPAGSNMTVASCLDSMINAVKAKIIELKSQYPNRPLILLGWSVGALIASQLSLQETVSSIVCLGFPSKGLNGYRGELDDPIFQCKNPCLFVIGQESSVCNQDDIEKLREKMKATTGLIIVGGADERLRMSKTKKKIEGVTQSMVDKCIIDEIGEFLHKILTSDMTKGDHKAMVMGSEPTSSKKKDKDKKDKKRKEHLYSELKERRNPPFLGMKRQGTLLAQEMASLPTTPKQPRMSMSKITTSGPLFMPAPRTMPAPRAMPTPRTMTTPRPMPSLSPVTLTSTSMSTARIQKPTPVSPPPQKTPATITPHPESTKPMALSKPGPSKPRTHVDNSFSSQYAHFLAQLSETDGRGLMGSSKTDMESEDGSGSLWKAPVKRRLPSSPTTIKRKQMRLVSLPIITQELKTSTPSISQGTSTSTTPIKADSAGDKCTPAGKKVPGILAGKGTISFEKLKVAMNQIGPRLAAVTGTGDAGQSILKGGSGSQVFTLQQLGVLSRVTPSSTLLSGLNFDIQQGKSKDSKGSGLLVGGVLEGILGKGGLSKAQSSANQHAFIQALNSTQGKQIKQPRRPSGSKSPSYSKKPETKTMIPTIQLITSQVKGQSLTSPKITKSTPSYSLGQSSNKGLPAKGPLIPSEVSVQTIQKLQFHDFPLTTVSLKMTRGASTYTQAKILTDLQHGSSLTLNYLEDGKVKKVGLGTATPNLKANTLLHTHPETKTMPPTTQASAVTAEPMVATSVSAVTGDSTIQTSTTTPREPSTSPAVTPAIDSTVVPVVLAPILSKTFVSKTVAPVVSKAIITMASKPISPTVPKMVTLNVTNTAIPTLSKITTPALSKIAKPVVYKLTTPAVSTPVALTVSKATTPAVAKAVIPTGPKTATPTGPKTATPTLSKIAIPAVSTPATPTMSRTDTPAVSKAVIPTVPKTAPPALSKTAPPALSKIAAPTLSKIATPAVSTPVTPTMSRTATYVVTKATTPTVSKPVSSTVSKIATPTVSKIATPTLSKMAKPVVSKPVAPALSKIAKPVVSKVATPAVSILVTPTVSNISTPALSNPVAPTVSKIATPALSKTFKPVVSTMTTPAVSTPITPAVSTPVTPALSKTATHIVTKTITTTASKTVTHIEAKTVSPTATKTATPALCKIITPSVPKQTAPAVSKSVSPTVSKTTAVEKKSGKKTKEKTGKATSRKRRSTDSEAAAGDNDKSNLPTLSAVVSTRTRKIRTPRQLSDYTEFI